VSFYYPNVDQTFIFRRQGTTEDPYIFRIETAQVNNGIITLLEIPDFNNDCIVKKLDGTILIEVTTETVGTNQYRVDYSTGVIYVDSILNGNKLEISYYGKGYVSFPSSRIWIDTNTESSEKSIQQLVNDLDNSKTNWLVAVATYTDIPTTYPTSKLGDTVQTTDDSKIYRYDGSQWVYTQEYSANALTNLQNTLNDTLKVPNDASWISTDGQDTFTIPNGSIADVKLLTVYVGGVPQTSVTLIDSTTFQLPETLSVGVNVYAKWFETKIPMNSNHHSTHELGGADEIDITNLKNYQEEISIPLTEVKQYQKDFNFVNPSYYTNLELPIGLIMQGFYFSQNGKYVFAVVATGIGDGSTESYTLYRLTSTGKIIDYMTLTDCGHGTVIGIEDIVETTYIWSNIGDSGTTNKLVRFRYVPDAIYTPTSTELVTYDDFGNGEYVYPSINGDKIIICRKTATNWVVEQRYLSDIKKGINQIINQITIPNSIYWLQGFTVDEDDLYWLSGDVNATNFPLKISKFKFSTGTLDIEIPINFGEGTTGIIEADYLEPEGIFMYTDSTGAKSLFVGITTGDSINRYNKIFGYHSILNSNKFQGYKNQDIPINISKMQNTKITADDGRQLFYISSSDTIYNTLKDFKGLATVYCEVGVADAPDSNTSCRILANIQDVGVGNLINIDWKNQIWMTSIIRSNNALNAWERIQTYNLLEPTWNTLSLINGVVAWNYPPQYRKINNKIQLKGSVGNISSGDVIGNLPIGYRSTKKIRKLVAGDGGISVSRVTIDELTGDISVDLGSGITAIWLDMEFDAN
jgi:hypothetical protein